MNIYNKKFVHFEWDDMLEGKRCVVSDLVSDIRQYVNSTTDTLALLEVKNSGDHNYPFSTGTNCHLFCYYDPLLEFKIAFNEGKKVQVRVANTSPWHDIDATHVFDESLLYRVVEEEAKPERLTNRQLAKWLADGNGEAKHDDGAVVAPYFIYYYYDEDKEVSDNVKVRKWTDTEWHEPTVDYCFPEQGEKNE